MSEPRRWWVFYIDPTEPQGSGWKTAGVIGSLADPDEAIARTAGRMFEQPFWAFALGVPDHGSFYDLHYPPGYEDPFKRAGGKRIGPSAYVAVEP